MTLVRELSSGPVSTVETLSPLSLLQQHLLDHPASTIVDVAEFGAVGDRVADDTDAWQSALDDLPDGSVLFAPLRYKLSAPVTRSRGGITILGAGAQSQMYQTVDADIFQFDTTLAGMLFVEVAALGLYNAAPTVTNSAGIHVLASTGAATADATGLKRSQFRNLWMQRVTKGFSLDKGKNSDWSGIAQISPHTFIRFSEISIEPAAETTHGIFYAGGVGTHSSVLDSHLRGSVASFQAGDNTPDEAVGDLLIVGNHMVNGQYGVLLEGASNGTPGGSVYTQNITLVGNQYDGITVATVKMRRLSNFRVLANSSTTSAGLDLDTCWQYQADAAGPSIGQYEIREKRNVTGAGNVDLLKVTPSGDSVSTVHVEVFVEGMVSGWAAQRGIYWRGFLRFGGALSAVQYELNGTNGAQLTVQWVADGTGMKLQAVIAGGVANATNRIRGTAQVVGRHHAAVLL